MRFTSGYFSTGDIKELFEMLFIREFQNRGQETDSLKNISIKMIS